MAVDLSPALPDRRFPPSSRYHGLAISTLTAPDGHSARYLRRRFLPDPTAFQVLLEHLVRDQSERLDNLAAQYLGDPLQFWRICDANEVLQPADLVAVGAVVRISLPEGISGPSGA
jgi:hypothetical protein